jgi:hypothetical protein
LHQSFEFILADGIVSLENGHGLVPRCRHYTKVVMPLQSPVVNGCMPKIVKDEILYAGPPP